MGRYDILLGQDDTKDDANQKASSPKRGNTPDTASTQRELRESSKKQELTGQSLPAPVHPVHPVHPGPLLRLPNYDDVGVLGWVVLHVQNVAANVRALQPVRPVSELLRVHAAAAQHVVEGVMHRTLRGYRGACAAAIQRWTAMTSALLNRRMPKC